MQPEKPICIIPARGGSKRIPRKNIADFNGKPLIAWPIATALESNVFSKVVVTTDDQEIAKVAEAAGAEIPFIRDAELADDFASTADVITDALAKLPPCDQACCLYPTAPLLTAQNLREGFRRLMETRADCVLSVTEYDFHPLRAFEKSADDSLAFNRPEFELTRSQDLPNLLHDAGAFYFFDVRSFLRTGKLIGPRTFGIELSRLNAVDIDTREDFELAEILHARILQRL